MLASVLTDVDFLIPEKAKRKRGSESACGATTDKRRSKRLAAATGYIFVIPASHV